MSTISPIIYIYGIKHGNFIKCCYNLLDSPCTYNVFQYYTNYLNNLFKKWESPLKLWYHWNNNNVSSRGINPLVLFCWNIFYWQKSIENYDDSEIFYS